MKINVDVKTVDGKRVRFSEPFVIEIPDSLIKEYACDELDMVEQEYAAEAARERSRF